MLSNGLIGAARDHLWHHHLTTLLERLSRMWAKHTKPMPDMRSLYPAAWDIWFKPAANPDAKRLANIFRNR